MSTATVFPHHVRASQIDLMALARFGDRLRPLVQAEMETCSVGWLDRCHGIVDLLGEQRNRLTVLALRLYDRDLCAPQIDVGLGALRAGCRAGGALPGINAALIVRGAAAKVSRSSWSLAICNALIVHGIMRILSNRSCSVT